MNKLNKVMPKQRAKMNCPKIDTCHKPKEVVGDTSILESQRKEIIESVCEKCGERSRLHFMVEQ